MTGVTAPRPVSRKAPVKRVALPVAFVVLLAWGGEAGTPTPTPGPAARVGGTLDQAWATVQGQVADVLLLTRVRVALLEHLGSDGLRVRVETRGGIVELSGAVEKRSSEELAEQVARSVSGVREVRSRIKLSSEAQATEPPVARVVGKVEREVADAVLEGKVKTGLLEELGKVAFDIEVEATDGVVSLTGTVPDSAREKLAVKIAKGTPGVKELHDLLKVK
jgi:hyperosmotically inducible protein